LHFFPESAKTSPHKSMEDQLIQLNATPEDWGLRCTIAQSYYEAENYDAAAALLKSAPEVPGDEKSVLFAATIIGATDPEEGQKLLADFESAAGATEGTEALKGQLADLAGQTEPVPEVTMATPVAPKKLRPPGEEDAAEEEIEPTLAPSLATGSHNPGDLHDNVRDGEDVVVEGHEDENFHEIIAEDDAHHERSFIVGEGEAVHAADRAPDTNEKVGAVLIAAIIHVILIVGLMFWAMAEPPGPPPTIAVSSAATDGDASLENQTVQKMTQKTASAVATAQPVISSTAFSSFAIPDTVSTDTNLTMVSMADSDSGFGMSMSGFGDVSNMGAIPAGMRSRCSMSQRMKRLRESGGEDRAERAVREGLEFITSKQNKGGAKAGSFGQKHTAAMTGLALLAYLGHCETPESPKFGDSVVNAALYLMDRCLKNDGKIVSGNGGHSEIYEHAIATYALCELYTMTKESGKEIPRLESVLKKAVGVITDAQMKDGGWSYGFDDGKGKSDMSVNHWTKPSKNIFPRSRIPKVPSNTILITAKESLPSLEQLSSECRSGKEWAALLTIKVSNISLRNTKTQVPAAPTTRLTTTRRFSSCTKEKSGKNITKSFSPSFSTSRTRMDPGLLTRAMEWKVTMQKFSTPRGQFSCSKFTTAICLPPTR
jgi:hypothetical protein